MPRAPRPISRAPALYAQIGQHDRAIADLTEAIKLVPNAAGPYYNRGFSYFAKGQYDQAIADYSEAIRLNPRLAVAYNNRCLTRAVIGKDLVDALHDCDEALKLLARQHRRPRHARLHLPEARRLPGGDQRIQRLAADRPQPRALALRARAGEDQERRQGGRQRRHGGCNEARAEGRRGFHAIRRYTSKPSPPRPRQTIYTRQDDDGVHARERPQPLTAKTDPQELNFVSLS